jgi:hypothetical protein
MFIFILASVHMIMVCVCTVFIAVMRLWASCEDCSWSGPDSVHMRTLVLLRSSVGGQGFAYAPLLGYSRNSPRSSPTIASLQLGS